MDDDFYFGDDRPRRRWHETENVLSDWPMPGEPPRLRALPDPEPEATPRDNAASGAVPDAPGESSETPARTRLEDFDVGRAIRLLRRMQGSR